jgi:hypothetical protein
MSNTHQAFWFWLVGLGIVVPSITYISAMLIGLLLVSFLDQIGISSSSHQKAIALGIGAICAAVSLFGYYRLWLLYRQKKCKRLGTT